MSARWELTDIEFYVLWKRVIGGSLPRPLSFQSTIIAMADFEQAQYEAWNHLQATMDPALRSVLEVLERPDVYLRLRGWNDRERGDAQRWLKARAARAGANGYLIYQLPGETPAHSGGFVIEDCGPHGLAEAVVDLMPAVGAGQRGVLPLAAGGHEEAEESRPRSSMFFEDADTSVARTNAEFFETPADRTGTINILQNQSMFGSRGMQRDILVWRDLPDDGRYVIELPSDSPTAVPMNREVLIATVDKSIARMMARVEAHWEARL
ncbi:ESX secretion-associated protein EspG [Nocardia thailandica]